MASRSREQSLASGQPGKDDLSPTAAGPGLCQQRKGSEGDPKFPEGHSLADTLKAA